MDELVFFEGTLRQAAHWVRRQELAKIRQWQRKMRRELEIELGYSCVRLPQPNSQTERVLRNISNKKIFTQLRRQYT